MAHPAPLAQLRQVDENAWRTLINVGTSEAWAGTSPTCQAVAAALLGDAALAAQIISLGLFVRAASGWPDLVTEARIHKVLFKNRDQPDFDRASALAAIDSEDDDAEHDRLMRHLREDHDVDERDLADPTIDPVEGHKAEHADHECKHEHTTTGTVVVDVTYPVGMYDDLAAVVLAVLTDRETGFASAVQVRVKA